MTETIRAVDGRYIGVYVQDKQRFDLKRKKSTGLYREGGPKGGWAIDCKAVDDLIRRGLITIRIYESEEGNIYELGADYFRSNSKVIEHEHYGRQYVLSIERFAMSQGPRQEALGI